MLSTDRLLLREFEEADHLATNRYESDPEVVRFHLDGVFTPEESLAFIRGALEAQAVPPRTLWELALIRRSGGDLIGRAGLQLRPAGSRRS